MQIAPVTEADVGDWLTLRQLLFTDTDDVGHEEDAAAILDNKFRNTVLLCRGDQGEPLGFAEVSLRHHVDGCHTSPVGYLEGLFVVPRRRRQGLARQLVEAAEDWVRARGCQEFASDIEIGNEIGQQTHQGLGFEETERVVLFRKALPQKPAESPLRTAEARSDSSPLMPEMVHQPAGGFSGWIVFHVLVGLAGAAFIYLSDISSPDPMAGAIYPALAVVCVIYVGVVLAVRRYSSRTDERNRGEELFSPGNDRD